MGDHQFKFSRNGVEAQPRWAVPVKTAKGGWPAIVALHRRIAQKPASAVVNRRRWGSGAGHNSTGCRSSTGAWKPSSDGKQPAPVSYGKQRKWQGDAQAYSFLLVRYNLTRVAAPNRWADDALFFHQVNQPCSSRVADAQPPLK